MTTLRHEYEAKINEVQKAYEDRIKVIEAHRHGLSRLIVCSPAVLVDLVCCRPHKSG